MDRVTRQVASSAILKLQQSHSLQRNRIGKSPLSLKVRGSAVESKIGGSKPSLLTTFNFSVEEWLEIRIVVLNRKIKPQNFVVL